jgi:hypothetical protein
MKKWFGYIGFILIIIASFRAVPIMLQGNAELAKRVSGPFLFPGLILVVIWFVLDIYHRRKSEQKNEIIKNVPNMTKYEFVKKHSFVLSMLILLIVFVIMSFLK